MRTRRSWRNQERLFKQLFPKPPAPKRSREKLISKEELRERRAAANLAAFIWPWDEEDRKDNQMLRIMHDSAMRQRGPAHSSRG